MDNKVHGILEFAEALIYQDTGIYCSELQRSILLATFDSRSERKTYEQLAAQCGYSKNYVSQDVAPKLWRLLSKILGEKTTKSNIRSLLERKMSDSPPSDSAFSPSKPSLSAVAVQARPALAAQVLQDTALSPPSLLLNDLGSPANILLVDDQPKNLRLLSDLLDEQGYEVQQAINGRVALQTAKDNQPDLILLDIHMPDMDGYTVCQCLKADPATQAIPVIFVSALDEAWNKVRAFSVGGAGYVTKPFKVVEVLARIENQLKIHHLQQTLADQNRQLRHLQQTLADQNRQLRQEIEDLKRLVVIDELPPGGKSSPV